MTVTVTLQDVAMWLFGAAPDDVERPVVVLDVRVTEPHIFVGRQNAGGSWVISPRVNQSIRRAHESGKAV